MNQQTQASQPTVKPATSSLKDKAPIINEKMATYLKNLRNDKNLTMRALADVIGTPHSFIGKIEQQGRRMDVGEFILYCQSMNKNPTVALQDIIDSL
jgi:ribosome-binding protein aMBF1 (putative translation factor)